MGRARRARSPSIARASTGLSSALPLPAGCQHPTLEGAGGWPILLSRDPVSSRSTWVVAGDGVAADGAGVTLLDESVLRDALAGLPTRRRILRMRRAGSSTLPPRKVGSTRRAPVARFRPGRRSGMQPSRGRARRYSGRIRRNTTPSHPSSRRAPPARHAESHSEPGAAFKWAVSDVSG